MSPARFGNFANPFSVSNLGSINNPSSDNVLGVRPVIALKPDVIATGTGSATDPYVVQ